MIKIPNLPPDCRVVSRGLRPDQSAIARVEPTGAVTDKIATETWAAEPTLRYIRDYVAQTLKKAWAAY